MGRFDGKVALIGGNLGKIKKSDFTMGLGAEIAKRLIEEGAQVCVVDTDFEIAKACANEVGGKIKAYDADLLKDRLYETEQYEDHRGVSKTKVVWTENPALTLIETIVQEFGKIDILITNFDYFDKSRLDSYTDADFIKMREENITPTFHLLAAVREQMANQTKSTGIFSKVVMITSSVGKAGMTMGALYASFKGAIVGLTKSLSREFGRFANVNAVACGPFAEKKMQGPRENIKDGYMSTQTELANQPLTFDKVVPMVALLASDEAMGINGQIISVDGGLWLKLEQ